MPADHHPSAPDGARKFTSAELDTSIVFRRERRLLGEAGERLLGRALAELLANEPVRTRRRKEVDLLNQRTALSAVLANLVAARRNLVRPQAFVATSFDAARYVGDAVTVTALRKARDGLARLGLVEGQKGYQRLVSGGGFTYQDHARTTRLRATPQLASWFTDAGLDLLARPGTPPSGIGWVSHRGLIVRREPADDLPEPDDVRASRGVLTANNRLIASAELDLSQVAWGRLQRAAIGSASGDLDRQLDLIQGGDTSAVSLRRVFRRTWGEGGRLYGGWWQTIPKAERALLTIDGTATVELDYGRLHPTLLYAQTGRTLTFDPYLPEGSDPALRAVGKRTLNRLINAANLDQRPGGLRPTAEDRLLLPEGFDFGRYVAGLVAMHAPIAQTFGTGAGVRLQRIDSDIIIEVLRRLNHTGVVALPIHDSVIVQADKATEARKAMEAAYSELTGFDPGPITVTDS